MKTKATVRFALNTAKMRQETLDGRKYLVAPTTLIVSGVLSGSKGSLLYPEGELSRDPSAWDNIPLTAGHPTHNGKSVSARSPVIIERFGLGRVYNVTYDTDRKRLRGEAWIDEEKTRQLRPDILTKVRNGQRLEISTGLFTDNTPTKGTYNGKSYSFVARDYRPDHLAVLDTKGACSVEDGCGLNVNEQTENANPQGCNQYGCKGGGGGKGGGKVDKKAAAKLGQKIYQQANRGLAIFTASDVRRKLEAGDVKGALKSLSQDKGSRKVRDKFAAEIQALTGNETTNQAQASFDDLRKALRRELNTRFGQVEVVDVFPKSVVYSRLSYGPQEADTVPRLYEVGYSADKRGKVTLDESGAKEVQRVTTYETVSNVGQLVETINAFCPTGKDGGRDNSCGGRKGGGGKSGGASSSLKSELSKLTGEPFSKGFSDKSSQLYFGKSEGSGQYAHSTHSMFIVKEADGTYAYEVNRENPKYGGTSGGRRLANVRGVTQSQVVDMVKKYTTKYGSGKGHKQVDELGTLNEATNQDGRRVGPSVFNQEEEPDMAHEPLTTNEREQLVEAMVTNCNSFGEDDREWLESQDDDRLRALAENCAEVKVLNERVGELEATLNKATKNKGRGMPPWLKKKMAEDDGEEDTEGEDDMEENSGCGKKKMAKNARIEDEEPDDDDDCECEDEEMTDNEWLENAPAGVRAVVERAMRAEADRKQELVKTITANKRCKFSKEFLLNKDTEELELMAELAVEKTKRGAPIYAGAATPSMRVENEEDLEEPMGIPEPDYAAYANVR